MSRIISLLILWSMICVFAFQVSSDAALDYQMTYSSAMGSEKVLLVVNKDIYGALYNQGAGALSSFIADLERDSYHVSVMKFKSGSAQELKSYLKSFDGLTGALFIGSIPYALFKTEKCGDGVDPVLLSAGFDIYPSDTFFSDLNGLWSDIDGDGVYDKHEGDVKQEIWVGRLDAHTIKDPAMSEVSLLNDYFRKNHAYRNHLFAVPPKALTFMDWDGLMHQAGQEEGALKTKITRLIGTMMQFVMPLYPVMRTWFVGILYPLRTDVIHKGTSLDAFKEKLKTNYEFVYVLVHGRPTHQTFYDNNIAQPFDAQALRANTSKPLFYNLGSCLVGRFIEPDYLAGVYLFGKHTNGLVVTAFTRVSRIQFPMWYYSSLLTGKTFGKSFKIWMNKSSGIVDTIPAVVQELFSALMGNMTNILGSAGADVTLDNILLASKRGLVILGDPTLKLE